MKPFSNSPPFLSLSGTRETTSKQVNALRMGRLSSDYFRVTAAILVATSAIKLISVAGGAMLLTATEPISGMQFRWLLLGESVVELIIATMLVSRLAYVLRFVLVFWLGVIFCSYHLVVAIVEPTAFCPCLGTLFGRLGVKQATVDKITLLLAIYFLISPVLVLGLTRFVIRIAERTKPIGRIRQRD